MCFSRSKAVLLFSAMAFLFGSFPANSVYANEKNLLFHIPILAAIQRVAKRNVSGYVHLETNGLEDVGIYDGSDLLAITNSQGYYETVLLSGLPYTLTAQKENYQFVPTLINIPGGRDNLTNQNFIANRLPVVTVNGNVRWITPYSSEIKSNPLSIIAIEAYEYETCNSKDEPNLFRRAVTDADGNYSLNLPENWCGTIGPIWESDINFYPETRGYFPIRENKVIDFYTPYKNETYTIKITFTNESELLNKDYFQLVFDGKNYAEEDGYRVRSKFGKSGAATSEYAGWIGDIYLQSANDSEFVFDPPKHILKGAIHSDMNLEFTATRVK